MVTHASDSNPRLAAELTRRVTACQGFTLISTQSASVMGRSAEQTARATKKPLLSADREKGRMETDVDDTQAALGKPPWICFSERPSFFRFVVPVIFLAGASVLPVRSTSSNL